ncbi:MAG: 4-hydroxybenzoate octaprenyltransferase [Luteimonas sp.]|nr:4-hydroxybenzoate octaprenyltransferase [Luteimonas sp.]
MRLDKPIGILLLLWPTLWGLWFAAGGLPQPDILLIFLAGTVLMRSAGCVVNDYADRDFDPHVERTKNRPLAAGLIAPNEALALAGVLLLLAFGLVLLLNPLTIKLAFAAAAIAVIYPFVKRVFPLPQAWLGLAFGFGIPMAYAAEWNALPKVAWLLVLATVFWAIAYDTEYAMVDRDDDIRMGAKSTAILFGDMDLVAQGVLYALVFVALALVGRDAQLGTYYWAGLGVAALLVAYEFVIARGRDRDACFRAFLHNHWVGAAIFAGIALALWSQRH